MELEFLQRAAGCTDRVAAVDASGRHTYGDLLEASRRIAAAIAGSPPGAVAFLVAPGFPWLATLHGIWRAGRMAGRRTIQ